LACQLLNIPGTRRRSIKVAAGDRSAGLNRANPTRKQSPTERLARFFPDVTPVRLPVSVEAGQGETEQTVLEFGTPSEIFFASRTPIEFGQTVRVHNADGSLDAEATIVAVHYLGESTAYAARFNRQVHNWIVKR
jgi:hypothetical protein